MADDINEQSGGTQGEETPKTYSEAELKELIEKARGEGLKEGESKAHSHWQSVADQKVSQVMKATEEKLAASERELSEFRKARMESMSPEEQQAAMLREVYERLTSGEKASGSKQETSGVDTKQGFETQKDSEKDSVKDARSQFDPVLKELGLDPSKVDWADDAQDMGTQIKRFVQSLIAQQKAEDKGPTEEEQEAERVNTSRSVGATKDILKADPWDLVNDYFKETKPDRRHN